MTERGVGLGLRASAALALALAVAPAAASRVRPLGLGELTHRAERIFAGSVTERVVETDRATGLVTTRLTFAVSRWIKGAPAPSVTLRVLGDLETAATRRDMPRLAPGAIAIFFFDGDSARGLTSPVGFVQGVMPLVRDKDGREIAIPALGLATVRAGIADEACALLDAGTRGAGIDAMTLYTVIERLARAPMTSGR